MSFLLENSSEPITDQILAFLRIFSMRKNEIDHWIESDKVFDLMHRDCALDNFVEDNVRKFLLTRLKLLISNYPTKLEVIFYIFFFSKNNQNICVFKLIV